MIVTPEQFNVICDQVKKNRVTLLTLQDDLVDHLCCVVENKLESGKL